MKQTVSPRLVLLRLLAMSALCCCFLTPALAGYQPDLQIKQRDDAAYIGDGIYNTTGLNQMKTASVPTDVCAFYKIKLENDGDVNDAFIVTGPRGGNGWTIRYYSTPYRLDEVTRCVCGVGWTTPPIAAGNSKELLVEVVADATLVEGSQQDVPITITSANDAIKTDTVLARTSVLIACAYKPDIMAKPEGGANYVGDNVYRVVQGVGQDFEFYTSMSGKIVFLVKLQNDGTAPDHIKFQESRSAASKWNIAWFDAPTGGNEITPQAVWGTWITPLLQPGESIELRCEASPTDQNRSSLVLYAQSQDDVPNGNPYHSDEFFVALNTFGSPPVFQPDAMIMSATDATYTGKLITNSTGVNQVVTRHTTTGTPIEYFINCRNAGNYMESYTITGPTGADGWTVRYFDAVYGGNDITNLFANQGWLCSRRNIYEDMEFRIEVTPPPYTEGTYEVAITVTSLANPTQKDVVKAITTAIYSRQPDLSIRNAGEASFAGENIYNVIDSQTKSQSTPSGHPSIYQLLVQNDAIGPDSLLLTGDHGDAGWTVRYFAGEDEITNAMTGAGWTTPELTAGDTLPLRVEVIPDLTIPAGASKEVVITAVSNVDTSKTDAVKAVTTRAALATVSLAASPTAPRLVNTPITITATPIGGGAVEYNFRAGYQDAAGWHWSDLRGYQPGATFQWTPVEAHLYTLVVYAREQGSTAAYQVYGTLPYRIVAPLSAVSLAATPAAPQACGTAVALTAAPTGGLNVEYKFRAGYQGPVGWQWSDLRGYNTARTCAWTPTEGRLYTLLVYAREVGSTQSYDKLTTLTYRITTPVPTSVSLTANPAAPSITNTRIVLTAAATGAANVDYNFRYGYQDTAGWHWVILQGYSADASCQWNPTVARSYTLVVCARAHSTQSGYQATATLVYRVIPPALTTVNLTVDPVAPGAVNTPVTITASAYGAANVEYHFRAGYQDATGWHWSEVQAYSIANTCIWTPVVARTYTLVAYARTVGNTSAYQVYGTISYKVIP